METPASIMIRVCIAFLLIFQTFVSTSDEFTIENQKIPVRENYAMRTGIDGRILRNDEDFRGTYSTDYLDTDLNPEKLPAMLADYANMIRNEIILLENIVKSRTKREHSRVKKHHPNMDLPCSCHQIPRRVSKFKALAVINNSNLLMPDSRFTRCVCLLKTPMIDLGEGYFPRHVETMNCINRLCSPSYTCQRSLYNMTVLKKSNYDNEESYLELPDELKHSWVAVRIPVTVACTCTKIHVN